jgi:pyruvate formate lyase activating enzyme
MDGTHGVIFDIQHFSLHDGPGVRSTVFFKGCPLSCHWCSNPESQRRRVQILHFRNNCERCGLCLEACPNDALSRDAGGIHMRQESCTSCGQCASACPQNARVLSGKVMTVEEISNEVRQHWRIFMQSGGGITCGGGEVLAQPVFLKALLETLHDGLGFHTCLDTSGYAGWDVLEPLLSQVDLILLDLKHMDNSRHKMATGKGNDRILHNARKLGQRHFPVVVRLPLIPDFNDTEDNLHALGAFMRETGLTSLEILPYHEFGLSKYEALGKAYTVWSREKPHIDRAQDILSGYGLTIETNSALGTASV